MNPARVSTLPEPRETRRDPDGRLTAVVIDSSQPPIPSASNTWLIAVDGSAHAQRASAEALRLVGAMPGSALHIVHVEHWLSKEAAETELARRGWEASADARSILDAAACPWRLHVVMGDCAATAIVRLAGELGCHGIAIGSRGLGSAANLLIGSVDYKVIHLSPISVLVVR